MKKLAALLFSTVLLAHPSYADTNTATTTTANTDTANTAQSNFSGQVDENEPIRIDKSAELVTVTQHDDNDELPYTIEATFPQIKGLHLTENQKQFNQLIYQNVLHTAEQFKNYVQLDLAHAQTLPEEERRNSLTIDYDIDLIKAGSTSIITVRFNMEGMQAGRAHPYHQHEVFNFDLNTGKLLSLKDLFKPRKNYLKIFSAYSKQQLSTKLTDKFMIDDGTAPNEKNYQNWNLEEDGILITFDEYQVAPYVAGAQEVTVPYSLLKNIMSPASPMMICVTNPTQCSDQK